MKRWVFLLIALVTIASGGGYLWVQSLPSTPKDRRIAGIIPERPFVVVIPSYNNTLYCEQNLNQNYDNFRVIYIDDCSKDDTFTKVQKLVDISPRKDKVTLIHNEQNQGALKNLYLAIHSCKNEEVVVTIDGDDLAAHPDVLKRLNRIYHDPDVWMTYGNYLDYPSYRQKPLICKPFPRSVVRNRSFRKCDYWAASHLRTFYAGLFKKIPIHDLLYEGKFLPMAWDLAFMIPMLEMAGPHHRFVKEVLYLYNRMNPISDHKINLALQSACGKHVRSLPTYPALDTVPWE
jgi:glycosyltransferase involved in cell wall biosynthesis